MKSDIPFNKPGITGNELSYIEESISTAKISGNGQFAGKCTRMMENIFSAKKVLLTPSCTAALEMATLLCDLGPGDEVILPSYTFVSTANALALQGVALKFVDIRKDTKNIDESLIEAAITEKTKAIAAVHYAGVGCDMGAIGRIADQYGLRVIEDAAQGVNATYRDSYLGTIGDVGAYSFHETKNFNCGEGGAIIINDDSLIERAEIIQEKGTNRQRFFRGQVDKYTWVDVGSSYLLADILAAFLYAQLEQLDSISARRQHIYECYLRSLSGLAHNGLIELPVIPPECNTNYHMFYFLAESEQVRDALIEHLKAEGIYAVFHYIPLHSSPMGIKIGVHLTNLPVTDDVSRRLIRLPFYISMTDSDIRRVISSVLSFYQA